LVARLQQLNMNFEKQRQKRLAETWQTKEKLSGKWELKPAILLLIAFLTVLFCYSFYIRTCFSLFSALQQG
jgi:hypothetical protein